MDDARISPVQIGALPARNEFDEEGYLQLHPDIAQGVTVGRIESGWQHFNRAGFAEGRQWLSRPDPFVGVRREISPRDEMFIGNEAHYFDVGESALHAIETALYTARRPRSTVNRILDLPCGHGRVLRFLLKAFPEAELTACDLNQDGIDFCARNFGAVPVMSRREVAEIPLHGEFDVIWCGSLLTHLPAGQWTEFLGLFHRLLGHRGILVFTTHGRHYEPELAAGINPHGIDDARIPDLLRGYREAGFAYVDYPGQSGYGFSLVHPAYVLSRFISPSAWQLLGYHEAGWDRRQDVISLRKN